MAREILLTGALAPALALAAGLPAVGASWRVVDPSRPCVVMTF